jgi:predicted P-loop ATPase
MAVDVAGLKATFSIAEVVGLYVELKRNGREYKGLCPFHNDRRPSLAVIPHKDFFFCHSCGVGGDAIAFVQRKEGCSFQRAVEIITGGVTERKVIPFPKLMPAEVKRKCYAPPDEFSAQPDMRIQPSEDPPHPWKLEKVWTYHGKRREILFYVGRYEWWDKEGTLWKSYRAFTYADDGWRNGHWQAPRPLYNLHLLTASPKLPVCLVEGEKSADAAGILGGGRWVAATWPGGSHAVPKADLDPLQDRTVYIWPDADEAGAHALGELVERLRGIAAEVWILNVSDCNEKWDAANALLEDGWSPEQLDNWLIETVGGEPRMRRHVYEAEPARTGILMPREDEPEAEAPERPGPRKQWDLSAVAKHWKYCKWRTNLVKGKIVAGEQTAMRCTENAVMPLLYADEWAGVLAWDELRQRVTTTRPTPWGEQPEEWADHHDTMLECWYDRTGLYFRGMLKDAVNLVAKRNSFHPVRDYLHSLKWDGTPRLDTWLTTYCGAPNNEFTNFVGKAWMISAVARAMQPGCQVKTVLILFGAQDAGKSEVFRVLGSPWFAVQNGSIGGDNTKAIEQCSKVWIIEMAELAKLKRADDVESIKSFISTYEDTYRPAYAHRVQTIPRCSVFCGTSNPSEVLSDPTGNVRFWPVKVCDEIDLETLRSDRDQLWAEATHRYKAGEKWWIEDKATRLLAAEAATEFVVRDEWVTVIEYWLDQPEARLKSGVTTGEILTGALKLEIGKTERREANRVGNIMRQLGYTYMSCTYTQNELMSLPEDSPRSRKAWRKHED